MNELSDVSPILLEGFVDRLLRIQRRQRMVHSLRSVADSVEDKLALERLLQPGSAAEHGSAFAHTPTLPELFVTAERHASSWIIEGVGSHHLFMARSLAFDIYKALVRRCQDPANSSLALVQEALACEGDDDENDRGSSISPDDVKAFVRRWRDLQREIAVASTPSTLTMHTSIVWFTTIQVRMAIRRVRTERTRIVRQYDELASVFLHRHGFEAKSVFPLEAVSARAQRLIACVPKAQHRLAHLRLVELNLMFLGSRAFSECTTIVGGLGMDE